MRPCEGSAPRAQHPPGASPCDCLGVSPASRSAPAPDACVTAVRAGPAGLQPPESAPGLPKENAPWAPAELGGGLPPCPLPPASSLPPLPGSGPAMGNGPSPQPGPPSGSLPSVLEPQPRTPDGLSGGVRVVWCTALREPRAAPTPACPTHPASTGAAAQATDGQTGPIPAYLSLPSLGGDTGLRKVSLSSRVHAHPHW